MKDIKVRDLETKRLLIKVPTNKEQYDLWNILRDEKVNRYYFPTPKRIFEEYNLDKTKYEDLQKARKLFLKEFNDWEIQKQFFEKKMSGIESEDNSQKYTWSIFLKNGEVIGQITVQPKSDYPDNPEIRNIGWFINPKYQGMGYCTEAAREVLRFMFEEVEIEKILCSAAIINVGSWRVMEKLGFERVGTGETTYFDEDGNVLKSYKYVVDKNTIKLGELRDLYDENSNVTGKTYHKGGIIPEGYYPMVVMIEIMNSKGELLMQKRSERKGGYWGVTGGHPKAGETPFEGIITEVKEELGLDFTNENIIEFDSGWDGEDCYKRYFLEKDINLDDITIQEEELSEVKWFSIDELKHMVETNEIRDGQAMCFNKFIKYLENK